MPRRPTIPCSGCGKLRWPSKQTGNPDYKPPTTVLCHECRRSRPGYRPSRMRARGVVETWFCAACGVTCSRPAVRGQRPKWCDECRQIRVSSGRWVPIQTRRAIYDRDDWTCGICLEPVDRKLIGTDSIWRASLDHIIPRSIGGTNDPENLRLAHFWCNSARCDERTYTDDDFQAA